MIELTASYSTKLFEEMVMSTSGSLVNDSQLGTVAATARGLPQPEIRVLQVFSVLSVGGAETWLMSLLRYFKDQRGELPVRVTFDILLTGGEKSVFDDEAAALGARLFYLPFSRRNLKGFIKGFRRILDEGNYDAIHDHQDYIAGIHFLMGAGHLPAVRVAHVHNPLYHRQNYASSLSRRTTISSGKYCLGRFATHVIGTSRQIVTDYGLDDLQSSGVSLGAVHCGIDLTNYSADRGDAHSSLCTELGWNKSAKIVLFVGRLDGAESLVNGRRMTHKNPAFALEVARECVARDDLIRMMFVGAGDAARRELEAKVRDWGLQDRIMFLGVRSDVPRLMLASNLLLFPSQAEGLGMVVVEAQAAGVRVLASDTTPQECVVVPELVKFMSLNEKTGEWVTRVIDLLSRFRPNAIDCLLLVKNSAFSIENSAAKLIRTYLDKTPDVTRTSHQL